MRIFWGRAQTFKTGIVILCWALAFFNQFGGMGIFLNGGFKNRGLVSVNDLHLLVSDWNCLQPNVHISVVMHIIGMHEHT